ncbi:hypothetical protein [Marinobacter xestospongiae]|uniref:hypothetical protein n=1 Tax=Marinobacter xestospongiae TaxID=994319 RepID=UPI0020041ED4|nr:hypothetical protein [Marinobacter xestospongiae]MCK7566765.1 hypothetical protein [Marinobacter xestospongiae]
MTVTIKRNTLLLTGLLAGGILTGCIDSGVDDSESYDDSNGPQTSAGGSCDSFTDIVSSSERAEANSCGTQVSAYYAQADSALSASIAHCQQGHSEGANNFYDEYLMVVDLGRDVKAELCGGSTGGGFEDPSPTEYFNLCTKSTALSGRIHYQTSCYGPFQQFTNTCESSSYSYLSNYSSRDACTAAAQNWLDRMTN